MFTQPTTADGLSLRALGGANLVEAKTATSRWSHGLCCWSRRHSFLGSHYPSQYLFGKLIGMGSRGPSFR
jgi:hypothetical protein